MMNALFNENTLYYLIPLFIFFSRVIDVSMGTVRIILANKGFKRVASLIGFVEVLLWIAVMSLIIDNLTNVLSYIAYALGFAVGTYIGITIEEKISLGQVRLSIITNKNLKEMIDNLKPTKYVFVSDNVTSSDGKIKIINAFIERKYLNKVLDIIKKKDKDAFYIVQDLKLIKEEEKEHIKKNFTLLRKAK